MAISGTSSASYAYAASSTNYLDILAQASQTAAQMNAKIEIDLINGQIQKNLATKVAALQTPPDSAVTTALQSQITTLTQRASTFTTLASQYGANSNTLVDMQSQLAAMQTAAAAGDATSFDAALQTAANDVYDLGVIAVVPPMQADNVVSLKTNGLGISSSATYDLSTPAGQTAAAAAVQSAQTLIQQIAQVTTSNQIVAGSLSTALTNQAAALNGQLSQMQQANDASTTAQIAQLTQQAQTQEHLIELAIGNTTQIAQALQQAQTVAQPVSSPLDALQNAASGTTSSSLPAILSLWA